MGETRVTTVSHDLFFHQDLEVGTAVTGKSLFVDELPNWASQKFNTRTDREGSLLTGVSMGGYGSLKIGF